MLAGGQLETADSLRAARLLKQDSPLPIGSGQTISQPYIVALTADAISAVPENGLILEIGTGCGYSAAVLSRLVPHGKVVTVERISDLAKDAAERLAAQYPNVHVHVGDGTLGYAEGAPYDAIAVTAAGPGIPASLVRQLKVGGVMCIPIGTFDGHQELTVAKKLDEAGRLSTQNICDVRFVPLLGEEGFRI